MNKSELLNQVRCALDHLELYVPVSGPILGDATGEHYSMKAFAGRIVGGVITTAAEWGVLSADLGATPEDEAELELKALARAFPIWSQDNWAELLVGMTEATTIHVVIGVPDQDPQPTILLPATDKPSKMVAVAVTKAQEFFEAASATPTPVPAPLPVAPKPAEQPAPVEQPKPILNKTAAVDDSVAVSAWKKLKERCGGVDALAKDALIAYLASIGEMTSKGLAVTQQAAMLEWASTFRPTVADEFDIGAPVQPKPATNTPNGVKGVALAGALPLADQVNELWMSLSNVSDEAGMAGQQVLVNHGIVAIDSNGAPELLGVPDDAALHEALRELTAIKNGSNIISALVN